MIINGIYNVIIDFGKFCGFTELLYRQPIARIRIEHESFVSYILNILEVFKNYFKYFFNVMDYGNGFFNVCGLYFRVTKIRKSTRKFKHYKIINVHRRYMT